MFYNCLSYKPLIGHSKRIIDGRDFVVGENKDQYSLNLSMRQNANVLGWTVISNKAHTIV